MCVCVCVYTNLNSDTHTQTHTQTHTHTHRYCLASEFKFRSPHLTPSPVDGESGSTVTSDASARRAGQGKGGEGSNHGAHGKIAGVVCVVLGNKTKLDRCVHVRVCRARERARGKTS